MAFYEMLPGAGMPPGLQAGMDSVLNKKFGTSTTYPAEDWPDTVNLMGPLPEKTASGAIVTFSDGADEVPIRSWEVTLPASLSGYSAIGCTQINSDNLFLLPENDFSVNSVDFKMQNNSLVIDGSVSGGSNLSSKNQAFKDYFSFGLPAGTYYFTRGTWSNATYVYKLSDDTTALVTNSGSFTLTEYTVVYIGFYISLNTVIDNVTFDGYLKQGSSASSYSPQPKPTTATVPLGRTIYGGTADVVKGQGSGECVKVKFSDLTWFTNLLNGARQFYAVLSDSKTPINNSTILDGLLCYGYNVTYANDVYLDTSVGDKISVNTGQALQVRDYSVTTLEEFIAKTANYELVYPLATPETFTFTPITPTPETALGVNNFWADEGDSEVTYRADINLALGGN